MNLHMLKNGLPQSGLLVGLLCGFLLICCACTANHGTVERSPEVTRAFKNYEIWPVS
jgi:hypothetical protein